MKNNFKDANDVYRTSINTFFGDTLNKLSKWDDKWKKYYWDSLVRVDPGNRELYDQKYDSIISFIIEGHLMPLIEKYGYPGERLLGISAPVCYGSSSYRRSYEHNSARGLLMHYYSLPRHAIAIIKFFIER